MKVFVVVMSAPDDLRPGQVEQVGVAGDVPRVVTEAPATVRLLPAHLTLDQDAPRAVEQQDAPVEQVPQLAVDAHRPPTKNGSPPKGAGAGGSRAL